MLTKTSETAIQALVYLAQQDRPAPTAPATIAANLHASPSYMAKITSMLVKAGILTAHRGVHGGVILNRAPEQVTLLDVVGACQSSLVNDCCPRFGGAQLECMYHRALDDLTAAVHNALSRWTLADLMVAPSFDGPGPLNGPCKLNFLTERPSEG